MFKLTICILHVLNLFCLNVDGEKPYYDLESAPTLFLNFIKEYGKKYESHEELFDRFKMFKENLKKINDFNKKIPNTTFGITSLSDISKEEIAEKLSCNFVHEYDSPKIDIEVTVPVESDLDWRTKGVVTEVKDQKYCGSGWAFSVTGEVEGQNAIKNKQLVSLSEQELLDCSKNNSGCKTGNTFTAINDIAKLGGFMTEQSYPYQAQDLKCRFNASDVAVKIKGGSRANVVENDLAGLLSQYGPLSVGIYAKESWLSYTGADVFNDPDCYGYLNHAVLLVGYTSDYWIIKNSWGPKWGAAGYMKLKRGVDMCNIGDYVVVSHM